MAKSRAHGLANRLAASELKHGSGPHTGTREHVVHDALGHGAFLARDHRLSLETFQRNTASPRPRMGRRDDEHGLVVPERLRVDLRMPLHARKYRDIGTTFEELLTDEFRVAHCD